MGQVGFQDFWVAGSRMYFKRDAIDGVVQPTLDLGRVTPVNPSINVEAVELMDRDGGTGTVVDEALNTIGEEYEVVCSNMNPDNLAMMWLGNAPEAFAQTAAEKADIAHYSHPGHMLKLHDNDTAETTLFNYSSIFGAVIDGAGITTAVAEAVSLNASTRVLITNNDLSLVGVAAASSIILHQGDMADPLNARTYTVETISTTTITVEEIPLGATESGLAATNITHDNGAGTILRQKARSDETSRDWQVLSEDRGTIEFLTASPLMTAAQDLGIYAHLGAHASTLSLFKPQSAKSVIQGTAILVYSRKNGRDQTVREMTVSVKPSSFAVADEDFSNITFTFKVLSDLQAADPAGRMFQPVGGLPTRS